MTDLGTLREALQAPARPDAGAQFPAPLDIGQVIAKGRRLRRRRRVAAGAAAVGTLAMAVGVVAGASPGRSGPRVPGPAAGPAAGGRPAAPPVARPVPSVPSVPEGRVVPSGITGPDGGLVFYAFKIGMTGPPGTRFGIVAAYRDPAGRLVPAAETSETSGSATAAGFHAVQVPLPAASTAIPEFGYYAGPAATISGVDGGRLVWARTATWSADPHIVIFWFPSTVKAHGIPVQKLTARGPAGQPLPAGRPAVAGG